MINIKDVKLFKSQKILIVAITLLNTLSVLISKNYMFSQNPGYFLGFLTIYALFSYGALYTIFLLINIAVYLFRCKKILINNRRN